MTTKNKEQNKKHQAVVRAGTQTKLDAGLAKLDEIIAMLRELLSKKDA